MGYFNEKTGKWEHFGTQPVSDSYFKLVSEKEYDELIRDMMISSAAKIEDTPIEESEGIIVDMNGDTPIYSKGWKEFFSYNIDDR